MRRLRPIVHRLIALIVGAFNRNPWTYETLEFVPRAAYRRDGLTTVHNHSFMQGAAFQRAYDRAVTAAGWDYRIQWRIHTVLWAAATAEKLPGAFVECGTGRGFMGSAICEYLGWRERPFYLLDTFEPGHVTPDSLERHDAHNPVYANGPEAVRKNFREWPGVRIVVGRVPETLSEVPADVVAFLHIDMNNPVPEESALRHFWPKLTAGAVVLLDDYAYRGWEASHESADRVAAELGFSILSLPTGQGLAIKPA
jgi:hypothetical protein